MGLYYPGGIHTNRLPDGAPLPWKHPLLRDYLVGLYYPGGIHINKLPGGAPLPWTDPLLDDGPDFHLSSALSSLKKKLK